MDVYGSYDELEQAQRIADEENIREWTEFRRKEPYVFQGRQMRTKSACPSLCSQQTEIHCFEEREQNAVTIVRLFFPKWIAEPDNCSGNGTYDYGNDNSCRTPDNERQEKKAHGKN